MQEKLPLHGPLKPALPPLMAVPPIDQIAVAGRAVAVGLGLGVGLGLAAVVGVAVGFGVGEALVGVGEAPVGVALGPEVPDGVGVLAGARCGVSMAFPEPQPEITPIEARATAADTIRSEEERKNADKRTCSHDVAAHLLSEALRGTHGVKPY